jgi:uncharacterized membrane protein
MQLIDEDNYIDGKVSRGYSLDISAVLRRGLEIFRRKPDLFLIYTALFIFIQPMGGVFLAGPLFAGFLIAAHRIDKGKELDFGHFLEGFNSFASLFLTGIFTAILVTIGYFLLVIPGVYLSVAYLFAIPFVYFGKKDFWEGMELSRKLISREWFSFFGFILVLALINFLGALAFGVGVFFTLPITACAIYAAYDEIVGT